jgi:hypothetical protein
MDRGSAPVREGPPQLFGRAAPIELEVRYPGFVVPRDAEHAALGDARGQGVDDLGAPSIAADGLRHRKPVQATAASKAVEQCDEAPVVRSRFGGQRNESCRVASSGQAR